MRPIPETPRYLFPLLLALALASCEGEGRRKAEHAAVVERLTGSATARRLEAQGDPRPLTRGSLLYRDDAITTDGDSVIQIQIRRNGARLLLRRAEDRRLEETAAWDAPSGSGPPAPFYDQENEAVPAGEDDDWLAAEPDAAAPRQDGAGGWEPTPEEEAPAETLRAAVREARTACSASAPGIEVRATIGEQGDLSRLQVSAPDANLARCIKERLAVRRLRPRPPGGRELTVKVGD